MRQPVVQDVVQRDRDRRNSAEILNTREKFNRPARHMAVSAANCRGHAGSLMRSLVSTSHVSTE